MRAQVALSVDVDAPVEKTWAAATDWTRQGEWMLGTTVSAHGVPGVGQRLSAFTGVGPIGFTDTMQVTAWEPPRRCEVVHTGRIVRGLGVFEVRPLADGRSAFDWSEELDVPFGVLGRWGWPIVRPLFLAGVQRSLQRFAAWVPTR